MSDARTSWTCIIDTQGLKAISAMTGNLKAFAFELLSNGTIGVPTCVWQEFTAIYEDEAAMLKPHINKTIHLKQLYQVGAARIADKMNHSLSFGPYDSQTDLYAASIAFVEKVPLVTLEVDLPKYAKMKCTCESIQSWIESSLLAAE